MQGWNWTNLFLGLICILWLWLLSHHWVVSFYFWNTETQKHTVSDEILICKLNIKQNPKPVIWRLKSNWLRLRFHTEPLGGTLAAEADSFAISCSCALCVFLHLYLHSIYACAWVYVFHFFMRPLHTAPYTYHPTAEGKVAPFFSLSGSNPSS